VKSSGYNKPSGYNIIKSKPLKPSYLMRDKNKSKYINTIKYI